MQAGFRVIAFDNRGFGESEKPPPGYRNVDYERLATALMDSLHIQDAVLVGHSMGGAIAAEVAIRDPRRVRGLVLIGAAGLGAREPLLFKVARWPVLGPLMVSFRGRSLTERLLRSTYADPEKVTPADVDQYYAAVAYPAYGAALRAVLREFDFNALDGRLERIQPATLLIWGAEDRWVPLGAGRAIAAQLLRAAFVIVPHAGHAVQEEAPAETNRFLIRFLTQGLPRVPENLSEEADEEAICLCRGLFLHRMAGVRNDDKGCAQELSGNGPARAERNPAVLGTPDEERRGLDPLEAAVQGVEVKLAQHRSQRGAVGRVRNRSIVLIDGRGRDLLWIGVSGPEEPLSEAAAAERQHQGAEHGPAGHLEQQGFAGAESGRADEHEGADAPRVADRYLGGDRAPHRVSHQHGILNVKRVQQGGREPLVVDVAVSGGRLLRLPEAAGVERNDAEPRLHDRRQGFAAR